MNLKIYYRTNMGTQLLTRQSMGAKVWLLKELKRKGDVAVWLVGFRSKSSNCVNSSWGSVSGLRRTCGKDSEWRTDVAEEEVVERIPWSH